MARPSRTPLERGRSIYLISVAGVRAGDGYTGEDGVDCIPSDAKYLSKVASVRAGDGYTGEDGVDCVPSDGKYLSNSAAADPAGVDTGTALSGPKSMSETG